MYSTKVLSRSCWYYRKSSMFSITSTAVLRTHTNTQARTHARSHTPRTAYSSECPRWSQSVKRAATVKDCTWSHWRLELTALLQLWELLRSFGNATTDRQCMSGAVTTFSATLRQLESYSRCVVASCPVSRLTAPHKCTNIYTLKWAAYR